MTIRFRPAMLGLFSLACLLPAAAAHASWPVWGGDASHSMVADKPVPAPLAVLWKYVGATPNITPQQGRQSGHRHTSDTGGAIIDGNTLFFGSKNVFYAIDATTGNLKWRMPEAGTPGEGAAAEISAAPAVAGGRVFVPQVDGTLTAYGAADGKLLWEIKTRGAIFSAPLVVGDIVYFGSDDTNVYAADVNTGNILWAMRLNVAIDAAPCYQAVFLYVLSSDNQVWCIATDTRKVRWVKRVTAPTSEKTPTINGSSLFLAAGSSIVTFHLGNGAPRSFPISDLLSDISCTPVITDDNWYFGDQTGNFYSYGKTGRRVWSVQLDGSSRGAPVLTAPLPDGRRMLYTSTDKGFVYGIDVVKGRIEWSYRIHPPKGLPQGLSNYAAFPVEAPLVADGNRLYCLSNDGALTAFSPDAIDSQPPVITAPKPAAGTSVNGAGPLYFSVSVSDDGSGVNPDTIEMTLDGAPIEVDRDPKDARGLARRYDERISFARRNGWVYDPIKQTISWVYGALPEQVTAATAAEQRLAPGRHEMSVKVDDWRGNSTEMTWSFIADPSLPKPSAIQAQKKQQNQNSVGGMGGRGGMGGGMGGRGGMGGGMGGRGGMGGGMGGRGGMGGGGGGGFGGGYGPRGR